VQYADLHHSFMCSMHGQTQPHNFPVSMQSLLSSVSNRTLLDDRERQGGEVKENCTQ